MKKVIKYWAASYINTKADRIENNDSLAQPLQEKGYEIDLTTNLDQNHLLVLELKQNDKRAELVLKINGDHLTFSADCEASVTGQERFDTVVANNIEQIIAAVESRMN